MAPTLENRVSANTRHQRWTRWIRASTRTDGVSGGGENCVDVRVRQIGTRVIASKQPKTRRRSQESQAYGGGCAVRGNEKETGSERFQTESSRFLRPKEESGENRKTANLGLSLCPTPWYREQPRSVFCGLSGTPSHSFFPYFSAELKGINSGQAFTVSVRWCHGEKLRVRRRSRISESNVHEAFSVFRPWTPSAIATAAGRSLLQK